MGSVFSKTKTTDESSRSNSVSQFNSSHDAVPVNRVSGRRKTSHTSSTSSTFHEQTRVSRTVRTSTSSRTETTNASPRNYSPVYKRPLTLPQDASRVESFPRIGYEPRIEAIPRIGLQPSDKYDLSRKAHVVVFHHYEFKDKNYNRPGSKIDMQKIEQVFKSYRTNSLKVHTNCSLRAVRQTMDDVNRKDLSKNSCLIVFIMSHGNKHDTIMASDGEMYSFHDDIVEKCTANPTLKGKPKIFVLQACRGSAMMQTDSMKQVVSDKSDIVTFQSTYEGTVSYRDPVHGTFFMQRFLTLLHTCDHNVDIHDINLQLNTLFLNNGMSGSKQTPTMTTTLQKRLIFADLRKS